jgi:tetratricopeptide (TPR) repeat protein
MLKILLHVASWVVVVSALSACQVPFSKKQTLSTPQPQVPAAPVKAPETKEQLAIRLLLLNAEYTLAHDQLITPANDNAFTYYREVLKRDPENIRAKGGIQGIVMRYVDLARQAAARSNYSQAIAMLNNARIVDRDNLLIQEVNDGLREQMRSAPPVAPYRGGANEFLLDGNLLGKDDPQILQRIAEIAHKLKKTDSLAMIIARTDNEGRWIYQQLRAAVPGYLVRGDIKIGSPARVQLVPRLE